MLAGFVDLQQASDGQDVNTGSARQQALQYIRAGFPTASIAARPPLRLVTHHCYRMLTPACWSPSLLHSYAKTPP